MVDNCNRHASFFARFLRTVLLRKLIICQITRMQTLTQKMAQPACRPRPAARMPKGVAAPFTCVKPMQMRSLICLGAAMRDIAAVPVMDKGELSQFPNSAGVYAVFDKAGVLQYIGLTRKVKVPTRFSVGWLVP